MRSRKGNDLDNDKTKPVDVIFWSYYKAYTHMLMPHENKEKRKVNCLHKTKTLPSSSLKQLWGTHFIFIYLFALSLSFAT